MLLLQLIEEVDNTIIFSNDDIIFIFIELWHILAMDVLHDIFI